MDSRRSRATAAAVPGIPRDDDGPVFREPGKRRPLRWRSRCTSADCSPGRNGPQPSPTRSSARKPPAILTPAKPITGTGWQRWNVWSPQGRRDAETLHRYRDAWDHAADRTPHGAPIELRPEDFG